MKRSNWLLIGLLVLCLAIIPLAGCGVPQSEYEALQGENATLVEENTSLKAELVGVQSDLAKAQADYEAASNELAEIKEVYPPRDFSSLSELQDWLLENDVSERPAAQFVEGAYLKALEIQEDALKDGYIVSAWIDYYPDTEEFYINCTAVADGNVWMWNPETDELLDFSGISGLLKVR